MTSRLPVCAALLAVACGSHGTSDDEITVDAPAVVTPDAMTPDATTPDATPACAALPFGPPVEVGGVPPNVHGAWLTSDERAIYYSTDSVGGGDLVLATRPSTSDAFATGAPVTAVNDPTAAEQYPTLTPDRETLYFDSDRGSPGSFDIYRSQRASALDPFAAPVRVDNIDTTAEDVSPQISADGLTIYFASASGGNFDLYGATLGAGGTFGAPQPIAELNTTGTERFPVITADQLQIFFTRDGAIYTARRALATDSFDTPTAITELDTTSDDTVDWVSDDGCTLYLSNAASGQRRLYVSSRMSATSAAALERGHAAR